MPAGLVDPTPRALQPGQESVFDSALTKALRMIGRAIGADNPTSQVLGLMTTDLPQKAGSGLAGAVDRLVKKAKGIKAYHGSPHDFDQFSMSKIGTGEGAQAYGHGLYFSESPDVANTYRAKVSAMQGAKPTVSGRPINWDNPLETAAFELKRHSGDRERAAAYVEQMYRGSEVPGVLRSGQPLPDVSIPGRGYEVQIDADPDDFLDWDTPLSQQSEKVRQAVLPRHEGDMRTYLGPDFMNPPVTNPAEATGSDVVSALRERAHASGMTLEQERAAAAEALKQAGIPGIKYLDAFSRSDQHGTRNYVVFDDAIISILRKYGLLAPVAGAAAHQLAPEGQ